MISVKRQALLGATFALAAFTLPSSAFYDPATIFKFDGENPHSGVIADFNSDGIDDIAAVFPMLDPVTDAIVGSRINFLTGSTSRAMKVEASVYIDSDVRSMAAGDFNGDGQPDLAVAQLKPVGASDPLCGTAEGIVIFFGGHKEVEPTQDFVACVTTVPSGELTTLDADGDGNDDLVVDDTVLIGDGEGSFEVVATLPSAEAKMFDVNGDGVLDAATPTSTVCGQGDGTFAPCPSIANEPLVETNADGMIVTNLSSSYYGPKIENPAVLSIDRQKVADLNGDGVADLLGWAVTSLEVPSETYWSSCAWRLTTVRSFHKRAGSGRGSGYYRSRRMYLYTCSTRPYAVAGWTQVTYSLNRVIPASSALRATLIHFDGTVEQVTGPDIPGVPIAIQLTDIDGDGITDVLATIGQSSNSGNISAHPDFPGWTLFPGNGDGSFGAPEPSGLPIEAMMPGDFDGDGAGDFGFYVTPFDSEHMVGVSFHVPVAAATAPAVTDPAATDPAVTDPAATEPAATEPTATEPASTTGSSAQPTGEIVEFDGTVTEVGDGYFKVGAARINIDASSVIKFAEDDITSIEVGLPVQGKATEYTDGTLVATKAEFG